MKNITNDVYDLDVIKTNEIDSDLSCNMDIVCVMVTTQNEPNAPFPIAVPFIYGNSYEVQKLTKIDLSGDCDRQFKHIDILLYNAMNYIKNSIMTQITDNLTSMFYSYWALQDYNILHDTINAKCTGDVDFDSSIHDYRYFNSGITHKKAIISDDTIAFLKDNDLELYERTSDREFLVRTYSVDNIFGLVLALLHFVDNVKYVDLTKIKGVKLKCCDECGKYFITHNAKNKYCNHTVLNGKSCAQRAENARLNISTTEFPTKKRLDKRLYQFKIGNEDTIVCENITRFFLYEKWIEVSRYYSKTSGFDKWLEQANNKLLKGRTKEERRQNYTNLYFWLLEQEVKNGC